MTLAIHPSYEQLVELAQRSHQAGRTIRDVTQHDIDLARLYSYAFRTHVIGAFHAARVALTPPLPPLRNGGRKCAIKGGRQCAIELLEDLANLSMDPIASDGRALLSTFHRYDLGIRRVLDALQHECEATDDPHVLQVAEQFRQNMERISNCNGIYLTRDTEAPEHASFVVPNLGIRIVPLVYGDYHSWNLAYLSGQHRDVPCHSHREAVEIHLGYSPVQGETILGDCRAEVREGYAMPIPPGSLHGFVNHGEQAHHVPFIYGSLQAGGWGVFFDVEPQVCELKEMKAVSLDSPLMNGSLYLEREIARALAQSASSRWTLIDASATNDPSCLAATRRGAGPLPNTKGACGGLELGIARVTTEGLPLPEDSFRIVSVVRGEGVVQMAGAEQTLKAHDHFGIPAGLAATLWQRGPAPLVILDAVIR